ncbi:P22 phage major capsid protein family protein [Vibrio sp. SCSIO 43136]|uniref:P22 phage major capsid protein family protein n=1 Tax=Vibrio sp. SCSIO 43136 TaxID=2819101 RepID=UPI00207635B5|nr:P22 phage major capsid protein family protein [Vibrio sp. SCSIO 43136]USD64216.1 hypothetical protein J4N39_08840 [Vibrio sp. SCSIO 43136]
MPNNLESNVMPKLLKQFTKNFISSTILCNTVSRQMVNDIDASTGGIVKMKRSAQYVPQRTPDGDMTNKEKNPIKVGSVVAEVGEYITVFCEWQQVEQALKLDQLDELLNPIATDMAVELESELAHRMNLAAANQSGVADKAISKWKDVATIGALMKELGFPSGNSYCAISNFDETNLADLQTQLGVNDEVRKAWAKATIKENFAGIDRVLSTNNLPEYQAGTQVGSMTVKTTVPGTYNTYKDTYQMTVVLTGATATTGTLKAGQTLTFAGSNLLNFRNRKVVRKDGLPVKFTATVMEDAVATSGGDITVKLSGAAIHESGVNGAFNTVDKVLTAGDAVTVNATANQFYRPALAYHKDFFGLGTIVLPKLHATDSSVIQMPDTGFSIRVHRFSDGTANKQMVRFDLLPAFACFNPHLGLKGQGN